MGRFTALDKGLVESQTSMRSLFHLIVAVAIVVMLIAAIMFFAERIPHAYLGSDCVLAAMKNL